MLRVQTNCKGFIPKIRKAKLFSIAALVIIVWAGFLLLYTALPNANAAYRVTTPNGTYFSKTTPVVSGNSVTFTDATTGIETTVIGNCSIETMSWNKK
mgnify:CR=1 FL=1